MRFRFCFTVSVIPQDFMRLSVIAGIVGAGLIEGCKKQTTGGPSPPQGGPEGNDSSNLQQQRRTTKSARKTKNPQQAQPGGSQQAQQAGGPSPVAVPYVPNSPGTATKKQQVKEAIAQIQNASNPVGDSMVPGMSEEEAIRVAVELSLDEGANPGASAAAAPAVKVPGRIGIPNHGNTCYVASAVQLLSHAGEFKDQILALPQERFRHRQIGREFDTLVRQTWDGHTRALNVQPLRLLLAAQRPLFFTAVGQHDAQEALGVLLDEVAAVAPEASRALEIEIEQGLDSRKCDRLSMNHVREHVFIVPLPEEADGDSYQLEDLIQNAQLPEEVEYTFDNSCKDKHAGRSRRIVNTGQTLLVQLQRTKFRRRDGAYSKSFTRVQIPLNLNMGAKRYRLTGVIYHQGYSLTGGHYTAEVLLNGNQWIDANDSQITNINAPLSGTDARNINSRKLLRTPYVLLYQIQP